MTGKIGIDELNASYEKTIKLLEDVNDKLNDSREHVDQTLEIQGDLTNDLKLKIDEALVNKTEVMATLSDIEQKMASFADGVDNQGPNAPINMGMEYATADNMAGLAELHMNRSAVTMQLERPLNVITSDDASGNIAAPFRQAGITALGRRVLRIRQLLNAQPLGPTGSVEFIRESGFTNNAAGVSENTDKPESDITYELVTEGVKTVAHFIKASKQVLDDVTVLAGNINGNLQYGYMIEEDEQLLLGSGSGNNLNGLVTQATAYSDPGIYVQAEQRIDRLRLAMLQLEEAEYFADGMVLNHHDWAWIELSKDSQNQYLVANPFGVITPTLWGLPVVSTKTMTETSFLVGAFASATLFDRETFNIAVSTENVDDFQKNMCTIRGEGRMCLVVPRPESFVTGDFSDLASSGA